MAYVTRVAELEERLAAVRARIGDACRAAGRDPAGVTLVAVSKTWPASDVLLLAGLGVTDFGESYDAEAAAKAAALAQAGVAPRWHFVGGLQRNKARSVASYASVVHSLDRPQVVDALAGAARRAGRTVDGLVQVRLDAGSDARSGVAPEEAESLADHVAASGVRLAGVMCVAPLGGDARAAFARLREVSERVRASHPEATTISAGMTGDLADAIAEGSNCVRVGTALFGGRPPRTR